MEDELGNIHMKNLSVNKVKNEQDGIDLLMMGNLIRHVIIIALSLWLKPSKGEFDSNEPSFFKIPLHFYYHNRRKRFRIRNVFSFKIESSWPGRLWARLQNTSRREYARWSKTYQPLTQLPRTGQYLCKDIFQIWSIGYPGVTWKRDEESQSYPIPKLADDDGSQGKFRWKL